MACKERESLLVAAIDFGTTYSGYAFSFRHEFQRDPTKISVNNWSSGSHISMKAPTCVLIKPDGTFDSFGYEAEKKYAKLAETNPAHRQWFYFSRFKMMLFEQIKLSRRIVLKDHNLNQMEAKTVFAMVIRYLKQHLLNEANKRLTGIEESDIQWVLTVPAIWNDAAKQFMREAAVEAGIENEQLMIALEPEAAFLFCRHQPVEKRIGPDKISLSSMTPGSKYMVLDCGGGTVDITVHEVQSGGTVKEIHAASGGAWGGTQVDEAYRQFFIQIFGGPIFTIFKRKYIVDYNELFHEFEVKKRGISSQSNDTVDIRLPVALKETFEKETEEDLAQTIRQIPLASKITLSRDKLNIDASIVKSFFYATINSIVTHVRDLLEDPVVKCVSTILMVGGFSESPMLQEAIRKNFPGKGIIIPDEAGLAVVKGAVVFGHIPSMIAERVCKYTYGVEVRKPFDPSIHPADKRVEDYYGCLRCADCFEQIIEIGESVTDGEATSEHQMHALEPDQTKKPLPVYTSTIKSPMFTTDPSCSKLGTLTVPMSDTTGGLKGHVFVRMIVGGTELVVEARDGATGKITKGQFDFLG